MIVDLSLDYRIKSLVDSGKSAKEIAQILGMNKTVVYRKLRDLQLEPCKEQPTSLPFGVTGESYRLRATLGFIVTDLVEKHKPDFLAVSMETGLNKREISRAMTRPYRHDWTLSQIERTLLSAGYKLKDAV